MPELDWDPWVPEDDNDADLATEVEREREEEAPLFGCACENPLSVDTICPSCQALLEDQDDASAI